VKVRPSEKGKGRYQLGDKVSWQASSKTKAHEGEVVEVVKYGMYPSVVRPPEKHPVVTWPELMGAHYCREHESYVIEDGTGHRWWPRVGNLQLIEKGDGQTKENKRQADAVANEKAARKRKHAAAARRRKKG
jgi:hypothetical protein